MKKIVILSSIISFSVILFLGITFRKIFILNNIKEKSSNYINNDNYYLKITDNLGNYTEFFCSGIKVKTVVNNKNAITNLIVNCYDGEKTNTFIETNGKKIAILDSNMIPNKPILNYSSLSNNFIQNFKLSINCNIKEIKFNDNDCYYIKGNWSGDVYIEKETGLLLRMFNNSTIVKDEKTITFADYYYEFGNVTDEDLKEPDISQYEIQ